MKERLGAGTAAVYGALMGSVFLLAAPWFAPGGGYGGLTQLKLLLYAGLTALFLLLAAPSLPAPRKFFRGGGGALRAIVLLYLAWSLVSALASPWRSAALLGGSRGEGFLTLGLYALSCLILSAVGRPGKAQLIAFAAGTAALSLICILQLRGHDPLGLYPPGLGWADANLRYAGSYLGTTGNAGQTGAVLCTAAALFLLCILRRGGLTWLLALPLAGACYVLGRMGVTAAVAALLALLLLALPAFVRRLRHLARALALYPLVLAALFLNVMTPESWALFLFSAAAAYFLARFGPGDRPVRAWMWALSGAAAAVGLLYIYTYQGWRQPLREAAALLHGEAADSFGSGRLYIWRQVLTAVWERPLLGGGPDTLGLRGLAPYVWRSGETGKLVSSAIDAAHCEYLQTLVCQGIPAALCHLALPLLALWRFFRAGGRPAGVCAGAALCYGIQALFGISMCAAAPLFWILLGYAENLNGKEAAP